MFSLIRAYIKQYFCPHQGKIRLGRDGDKINYLCPACGAFIQHKSKVTYNFPSKSKTK